MEIVVKFPGYPCHVQSGNNNDNNNNDNNNYNYHTIKILTSYELKNCCSSHQLVKINTALLELLYETLSYQKVMHLC